MQAVQSLDTVGKKINNIDSLYDNDFLKKTKFIDPIVFSGEPFSAANNEFFVPQFKINTIEKKVDDNIIKDIYTNNANFSDETRSFSQDLLSLLILFDMKNKFMKNIAVNQDSIVNYLDQCSKLIQMVADAANSESKLKMAELQKEIENITWWSALANIVLTIIEIVVAAFAIATGNGFLLAITIMALAQTLTKLGASFFVLYDPKNQTAIDYMQNGVFAAFGSDKTLTQFAQTVFNIITLGANIFAGAAHLFINGLANLNRFVVAMITNLILTLIGTVASIIKAIIAKLSDNNDNDQQQGVSWDQGLSGGIGGTLSYLIFEILRECKVAPGSDKPLSEQEKWIIAEMISSAVLSLVCTGGITYKYGKALANMRNPEVDLESLAIKLKSALQGWTMQTPFHQVTNNTMNVFSSGKNINSTKVKADVGLGKAHADAFQTIFKPYETALKDSSEQIAEVIKELAESIPALTKIMNQILNATMKGVR